MPWCHGSVGGIGARIAAMTYVITWTTQDHKATIKQFKEHGSAATMASALGGGPGLKVLQSYHRVGEPSGFLVVEAEPGAVHTLAMQLGESMTLDIAEVLTDTQAKAAMEPVKH